MNFPRFFTFPKTLKLGACVSSVLCCGATLHAATLIPVVTTGYNQDIIVEKGAVPQAGSSYGSYVTATIESNISKTGTTYYESGLDAAASTSGLPSNNTPFTSADLPEVTFQLQPYTQNNSLLLTNNQTGTLTLTAPTAFSNLAFLVASGGGDNSGGTEAITLHFSDGTPNYTALSLNVPSWFDSANPAFVSKGRVDVPSGDFYNVGENNPRLYDSSFNLSANGLAGHAISSIDFTYSGSGNGAVFAVSGSIVPEPSSKQIALALGSMAVLVASLRARHRRVL